MGNTLKNKVSSVISLYSESDKVQDQKYQPQIQKDQNFTSNKISKSETNKYDIIKLIDGKHTENSPKNLNLEPYLNSPQVLVIILLIHSVIMILRKMIYLINLKVIYGKN